jgi:hypothetical protein
MIELLYAIALIVLGIYNWFITNRLVNATITIQEYNEMILNMAEELESLGSPNVKITRNEVS